MTQSHVISVYNKIKVNRSSGSDCSTNKPDWVTRCVFREGTFQTSENKFGADLIAWKADVIHLGADFRDPRANRRSEMKTD